MDLELKLKEYFGFDAFRSGQREVIESIVNSHSTLAVFPTGSGKSLCFQLPAVLLPGVTIVVSPLIALMKDQVDSLMRFGITAARLDSTLSFDEVKKTEAALIAGEIKLLYLSPEKFVSPSGMSLLKNLNIDLVVIDEVHCVSEWGHNFRPDYMKLARLIKQLNPKSVLGLTATATKKVAEDICKNFSISSDHCFIGTFLRPELNLAFTACDEEEKKSLLLQRLSERKNIGATLIYVTLQKTAEDVADFLNEQGYEAQAYHAGMPNDVRSEVQNNFMSSDSLIIVATIAFGMGVDKSNIRFVYHYNLPKSIEGYLQEVGRGGRDGAATFCELFASAEDITVLQNFVYGDTPDQYVIAKLWNWVINKPDVFSVSLYQLANEFDVKNLVLSTFFTYLEMTKVLEFQGITSNEIKVEFLVNLEQILASFSPERSAFLSNVFALGKMGRKYLMINTSTVAKELNCEQLKISNALNYLQQKNLVSLSLSGIEANYSFLRRNMDNAKALAYLTNRFIDREISEIERIAKVEELVNIAKCKNSYILNYLDLGQDVEKCGHCDYCLSNIIKPIKKNIYMVLGRNEEAQVKNVINKFSSILQGARSITKFLCGISSPIISKATILDENSQKMMKISSSEWFGIYSKVPFEQVLFFVESLMKRGVQ